MYNFENKFDPLGWDEKLMPWEKALYLDLLQMKLQENSPEQSGGAPTREQVEP